MNFKRVFFLFLLVIGGVFQAKAQQDAQFSQFMWNRLFFNPAFAGVEGDFHITALHRSQWVGYNTTYDGRGGAPNTQVLSGSLAMPRAKSGLGFHFVNDRLGALNNTEIQLSYAYHIPTKSGFVSLGARAGMYSQTLDFDRLRFDNPSEPMQGMGRETQMVPDVAAGIWVKANNFSGGLSYNHVVRSEFDFGQADLTNPLEGHLYLIGSYDVNLSPDWDLTPSVLVKSLAFNTFSVDLNVIATYNSKLWGGVSIRNTEAAVAMLGFSMLKDNSLKIGYAFDYVIEAQEVKAPTSHEFMARYIIPRKTAISGRKIVRTPRFRF